MIDDYRKYLEDNGITQYKVHKDTGMSRGYLSMIFEGKRKITDAFMLKFKAAYGFVPEGIELPNIVPASPEKIYVKVEFDPKKCMAELGDGVEKRIRKAFTKVPDDIDEFIKLMVGSWKTGVLDAGKFFASADAGE